MKKLDKNKPYGRVCGAGKAKFEQGGVLFDVHGNALLTDEQRTALEQEEADLRELEQEEADKANKNRGKGKKAATTEVDDQLAAQQELNG